MVQSSGAVWMSRWTSWAPRPTESARSLCLRSCVDVEVDVLGSTSHRVRTVSMSQELCGCRGGRPGLHVPQSPHGLYVSGAVWMSRWTSWATRPTESARSLCLRSCVDVEVDVLGSTSHRVRTVSMSQELCGCRGGRPGLHVPQSPHGLYVSGAVWMSRWTSWAPRPTESARSLCLRSCVDVEVDVLGSTSHRVRTVSMSQELCGCRGGRPGLHVPQSPHGLYVSKATLDWNSMVSAVSVLDVKQREVICRKS